MTRLAPVVMAMLSFTGCTLIDQTTFQKFKFLRLPEAGAAGAPGHARQPQKRAV